jgi:alkylhydroperoxidase family enzyme
MDPRAQEVLAQALVSADRLTRLAGAIDRTEREMLRFVVKLTRSPGAMTAADAASLRSAGFDDRAIHDICSITAYYAFVNRIADGLGVELERPPEDETRKKSKD